MDDENVHVYMESEPCPDLKSGAPQNDIAKLLVGLRWPCDDQVDVVAPTPGVQHHTALPASNGLNAHALPMESIFNEPIDRPRNLAELHRDRRYKKDVTYMWVGTELCAIRRPTFKENLPKPSVNRFWFLSTLIIDLGREHILAAYLTGEYWHSTDREAICILTETVKLEPFQRLWKALTDDDFVAKMVGALVAGSSWDYTKVSVSLDPYSLYFVVHLSRYLTLTQKSVQRVATVTTIRVVATLETCRITPKGIDNPTSALAGKSAAFASKVLASLEASAPNGETVDQKRVALWRSESMLEVLQAVMIELGSYPIAHGLTRTSKASLRAPSNEPPQIPYEAVAYAAAMVEARLMVLRDLPFNNNQVIASTDDDCQMSIQAHALWASHKDSVGIVTAGLVADKAQRGNKANTSAASSLTSRAGTIFYGIAEQFKGLTGKALRHAIDAQDAMKVLMISFSTIICLPVVDEQIPSKLIANALMTSDTAELTTDTR